MNTNIGQLFFIGIKGPELTSDEEKFIVENNIGGVVLFERNLENPKQIHALTAHLQGLRNQQADKAPLFIATDMEGGRIATLKEPFTAWPSFKKLSDLDSTSVAFKMGQAMGAELAACGINVNFAPCVDVLTNSANDLIGDRSAGSDPEQVSKMASAIVRGLIKSNIIPCAKHFPGHGNTIVDSHDDLPVDDISAEDLMNKLLPPFKKVFRSRLDMVMTAHVKYPCVDEEWPATLSEKFLKDLMRNDFRYRNLVVADDLLMSALSKNYDEKTVAVRALQAGCDLLMYAHTPDTYQGPYEHIQSAATHKEIDTLSISKSHDLILKIKKSKVTQLEPMPLAEAEAVIGAAEHKSLATAIESGQIPEEPS